jgi:hypothetical protein
MSRRIFPTCVAVLLCMALPLGAAEKPVESLLPAECGPGWRTEGPVSTYTRENLYKYIDGEAELYLPYGLQKAATVMYQRPGNKESGLVVNIFAMGSPLDAFGIYANYRAPSLEHAPVGAAGFMDESQLMFFQDRYFVQVMSSGVSAQEASLFLACGTSVASNLPAGVVEPPVLALVRAPGYIPETEKYFPQGLLGYGFLGKGLTSEVMLGGNRVRGFVVMGGSKEEGRRTFDAYVKYLAESKATPQVSTVGPGTRLHAVDPLFKGVVLQQMGSYAIGLTGLKAPKDGDERIDEWVGAINSGSRVRPGT